MIKVNDKSNETRSKRNARLAHVLGDDRSIGIGFCNVFNSYKMTIKRKIKIAELILKYNSDEFICLIMTDMIYNGIMLEDECDTIKVDMFGFLKSCTQFNDYRNETLDFTDCWFKESRDESNKFSPVRLNSIRINFLNKYIEHLKNQEPPMMGMSY